MAQYVKKDFLYSSYEIDENSCNSSSNEYVGSAIEKDLGNALCVNKKKAEAIINITESHTGAGQRYADSQGFSDTSMLNIFNLGIGIIGAALFIRKTYK